jgi:hypothetical protein
MAESLHPAASHHLPGFITAPGETDVLMVVMVLVLAVSVVMFGVLFFRLHALPEQIAHKSHKIQFEIVAVLGLISLFTHMHIFWIAGLLLALIDMPDFGSSLSRIAGSTEKMAGLKPGEGLVDLPETVVATKHADAEASPEPRHGDGVAASPKKPEIVAASPKELRHA